MEGIPRRAVGMRSQWTCTVSLLPFGLYARTMRTNAGYAALLVYYELICNSTFPE